MVFTCSDSRILILYKRSRTLFGQDFLGYEDFVPSSITS